jgi:hypothetical protein
MILNGRLDTSLNGILMLRRRRPYQGTVMVVPFVWRHKLFSIVTYGSLRRACSQLLSEADLSENHGCPNLFLPDHWRRHVKSALLNWSTEIAFAVR